MSLKFNPAERVSRARLGRCDVASISRPLGWFPKSGLGEAPIPSYNHMAVSKNWGSYVISALLSGAYIRDT